jgi:dienelactone hydrolase
MDPHVQPRCIALAKLGYVVLCIDAFGAGERAIEPGAGTYHGALTGAALWPTGCSLLGLQVYDNRRAVDYLISRPEVDGKRLAITGASGGGNQTLYAGALDERFTAVIPVCGIGTYAAYLHTACCVCEVNVGGAVYASTADLLAMVAPRALLVISATRDALQFSVAEASKSIAIARTRFRAHGAEEKIRQVSIESGHDYNQPMREAMYGWVEKWLKGRGDGSPVAEPNLAVEEIASIRCYADGASRSPSIVTIPRFARSQGEARLAAIPKVANHKERWDADAARMRAVLRDQVFGGFPPRVPLDARVTVNGSRREIAITTEPGLRSRAIIGPKPARLRGALLCVSSGPLLAGMSDGAADGRSIETLMRAAHVAGLFTLHVTQPRATGTDVGGVGPIADVVDHTPAEWALWIGRPLLGQWVWDIIRWIDLLDDSSAEGASKELRNGTPAARPYVVIGLGPMSLPVLLAAALDPRISAVGCDGCLASYVAENEKPWRNIPMGLLAPRILELADVGQLAALIAPTPLQIGRCVEPDGEAASPARIHAAFAYCKRIFDLVGAPDKLRIGDQIALAWLLR